MRNFGTLFLYEIKKVLQRRLARVTLLVLLLMGLFLGAMPLFATESSGSNYETLARKREAAALLNGRALDDALLEEMRAVYARRPGQEGELPLDDPDLAYDDLYYLVWTCVGQDEVLTADAGRLYEALDQKLARQMDRQGLTNAERAWWQEKAAQVERPIRYFYHAGPDQLCTGYYTLGMLAVFLAAVCLAGLFADERQRRTDQLLLCSRMGRGTLYLVKLSAGAAVSVLGALALFFAVLLPLSLVYGLDGWDAPIQLYICYTPYPMTIGQLAGVLLAVYLAAALLFGAAAMFFSELFQSSLASMALLICGMLLSLMLPLPDHPRLLAQFMEMLPNPMLAAWSAANYRLIPWFGGCLTELQAAPLFYLAASVPLAALGWLHYRRSQVGGR